MRRLVLCGTALSFLLGTSAYVRAECKPAAIPLGDPALVQSVSERLTANGVMTTAIEGCPAVRVHLERRGEQLHLRVADGFQRRGEREVQDVATAAAVIESWTVQEITDGTLPELASPAPPASIATTVAVTSVARERAALALSGNSSIASNGSTWMGGELSGCVRVGWACVGVSTTLSADLSTTDDATRGSQRSRELHALALVEIPRTLGRFTVSPCVGVGYGWTSFAEQHLDAHMLPLSTETTSHSLRARAQVGVSHAIAGSLGIVANLFGDVAAVRTEPPTGATPPARGRLGLTLGLRFGLR